MGGVRDLSGINSIGWQGEVNTFADLPAAADNSGKAYLVLTSTGLLITFNLKRSGLYYSDGITWTKKSDVQSMFADDDLTFQDGDDNTKQLGFQLSNIETGIRRIISWPNKSYTPADVNDITSFIAKIANYTSKAGDLVIMTTGGSDQTVNLPASPLANDIVEAYKEDSGAGDLILHGNGNDVQLLGSIAVFQTITTQGGSLTARFIIDPSPKWVITSKV